MDIKAQEILAHNDVIKHFIENAFDGINIYERDPKHFEKRKLVYCNNRFLEMSGQTQKTLTETDCLESLVTSFLSEEERAQNRKNFAQGLPYKGICSWKRPDGKQNVIEWTSVPLSLKNKFYTIGICRDITEHWHATKNSEKQKQDLERQIYFQTEKLDESNQMLTAFQEISKAVTISLDLEVILNMLSELISKAGVFRSLTVSLVNYETRWIEMVRGYIRSEGRVKQQKAPEARIGTVYHLDRDAQKDIPLTVHTGQIQIIESAHDPRLNGMGTHEKAGWVDKIAYFIPVKYGEQVLAVLATASTRAEKSNMLNRIAVMQPLLNQVAVALNHALLYRSLRKQTQRQEALLEIGRTIQQMQVVNDLEQVVQTIYNQLKAAGLDFAGMTIRRFIDEKTYMTQSFSIVPTGQFKSATSPQIDAYKGWLNGETLYRPDIEKNLQGLRDDYFLTTYKNYGLAVRSLLTVPYHQGTLVLRSEHAHAFSSDDIQFVRQIVEMISVAMTRISDIENLEMQNQVLQKSEQRIKEQFQELDDVYRHTPIGLFVANREGCLLRYNAKLAAFLGIADRDVGRSLHDFIPRQNAWQKSQFDRIFETGEPLLNVEVLDPSAHESGVSRTWLVNYYPLKTETGQINRILGTLQDMTQLKQAEAERIRTQRLRSLGEMAAGVSHNLNNLLTGILGPAQLLEHMLQDREARKEVDVIKTSALRAADIVRRLNKGIRLDSDYVTDVDVNAVIDDVVQATRLRWKDEAEARNISISIKKDVTVVPPVKGTQAEMHDILVNLIFNAIDAMPEGGTLTLSTRQTERGVRLSVKDTGIGMSASVVARIFDPFFTTKADVGTGLGLSTVYGTLSRWGGKIHVYSAPGQGSTFDLDLEVWAHEKSIKKTKPTRSYGRRGRILLVDDEEMIGQLLSQVLLPHHDVEVVSSVADAMAQFKAGMFDLLITDLGMPGMSGTQLAHIFRQQDQHLVTILTSGWHLPEQDARRDGFDYFLEKPFQDFEQLKKTIDDGIRLRDRRMTG